MGLAGSDIGPGRGQLGAYGSVVGGEEGAEGTASGIPRPRSQSPYLSSPSLGVRARRDWGISD